MHIIIYYTYYLPYVIIHILQHVHGNCLTDLETAIKEAKASKRKGKCTTSASCNKTNQQATLGEWRGEGSGVTQKILDAKVVNFVIQEGVPRSIVEKPAFKDLVTLGLPKKLSVMSRKTLDSNINKMFNKMTDSIREEMSKQPGLSVTADLWSKGKRFVQLDYY